MLENATSLASLLRSSASAMALSLPPRFMLVSDLDHTMVDHHDAHNISLLRFNALWAANYYHDSLLVFSTGRSPTLYKELRNHKPLLTPNITITSVGTEIMYGDAMTPDEGWQEELNQGWDRKIVVEETSKFPQLRYQVETEQRPHKVSFYVDKQHAQEVISSLTQKFLEHGLKVKLIYSGGIDLDILPEGAGKGQALAYLMRKLKSEVRLPSNTLVCGDSGNDAELFSVPDVYGVMVGNAQEELLQWYSENGRDNPRIFHATERCAAGIIQALQHFGLQPNISPRDINKLLENKEFEDEYARVANLVVEFYLLWERWECAQVEESEDILNSCKNILSTSCNLIAASGEEFNFYDIIKDLRSKYGIYKDTTYQTWLDRLQVNHLGVGGWQVRFNRWEQIAKETTCRLTTVCLTSEKGSGKLVWTLIHETWLKGFKSHL